MELYDEVTEDQYKSIVKGRLQQDDFVVDDGVSGYMDNGMDDWTGGNDQEDESDDEQLQRKKKGAFSSSLDALRSRILLSGE